ncbi:TatD family hydrolase [Leptolyngbya sp. 7M]|uniref:TatD family hydrolase n=1 Tax=Leptolyngbya sp. 7M TaxID=2812896 RepID=UPI001B8C1C99|nr:TatD family hydrolase [Leptolyngbya sp. 7M]QYO62210.1 TatD family hydrolase [Leptolyngbya sp. 7M]
MLIDSHCHIDGPQFDNDRDDVVRRARDAGVAAMLNVGTGDPHSDDFRRAVAVAEKYENVWASVGVHPHDAKLYDDLAEEHLIDLAENKKVIAWGEIGLDYYYDHSPRDVQREVFRRQIDVAKTLGLSVIIHSRDANDDTVQILTEAFSGITESSELNSRNGVGIMHCFAGTPEMAEKLMEVGFYISFAGNVTFKKADDLREAARVVPLERLLVETDCPYLTPVPHRGTRNEPAMVVHTAQFLAEFYGVSFERLAEQTTRNFYDLFRVQPATDQTAETEGARS